MYSKIKMKLKVAMGLICGLIVLVFYQNCSGKKNYTSDSQSLVSEQDVTVNKAMEILATKCSSCHDSAIKAGGVDVLNLDEMLARGVVIPNEPQLSLLFTQIQTGKMPPGKSLGVADVKAISDWIALGFTSAPVIGALPPATAVPLNATFAGVNTNILRTKCLGCHNANNQSGGVSFATYTSTMNTVQRTIPMQSSLYTSVAVRLTMPKGGAALNAAETKAIFDWITAGAANN